MDIDCLAGVEQFKPGAFCFPGTGGGLAGNDAFPMFSDAEMARRTAALDEVMRAAEVDHVVVYGANRAGSGVQWLTGWPVTREGVVVHSTGVPDVLLVQFFNHVPQARSVAWGATVRWTGPRTGAAVIEELDRLLIPYGGIGAHDRRELPSNRLLEDELAALP